MGNKKNIISLLDYRLKKQKGETDKKRKKIVSDSIETSFNSGTSSKKSKEQPQKFKTGQVYYMANYLKAKKPPHFVEEKPGSLNKKPGQIIDFFQYKKKITVQDLNKKRYFSQESPKTISLSDYRKKVQNLAEKKEKSAMAYLRYAAQEASSVAVMALLMLFVWNIFSSGSVSYNSGNLIAVSNGESSRGIATEDLKKKNFIIGEKINKKEKTIYRRLSSFFKPSDYSLNHSAERLIQKIKNKKPATQLVYFGKKPLDSNYKGF